MKKLFTKLALAGAMLLARPQYCTGDPLKVGFVYLTNPGDHGWTYAHEVGRQELQAHFGDKVETSYVKMFLRDQMRLVLSASLLHKVTR